MISVVIPCFNESEVLRQMFRTLTEAANSWGESYEVILVDDGSKDDTWSIIQEISALDVRVRGIRLSRNFGQQAALGAGFEHMRGDAVVILDADMQDPPSLVKEMIGRWREGYDIVYAQRRDRRQETWFKLATAKWFYRFLSSTAAVEIPKNVGEFALIDAKVVRLLLSMKERTLYWRGLRSWVGFRQIAVPFDRPGRAAGVTKYDVRALFRLASDAIFSFSGLPLRLPLYFGMIGCVGTGLGVAWSMITLLCQRGEWAISGSSLALFMLGSVQLLMLGVVGEYLNRIFDEVRARPRWIVSQQIGASETSQIPRQAA